MCVCVCVRVCVCVCSVEAIQQINVVCIYGCTCARTFQIMSRLKTLKKKLQKSFTYSRTTYSIIIYVCVVYMHTGTVQQLLPPNNVQLMEQSVDPINQSLKMIVKWDPVETDPSLDIIGYAVYVDGELYCSVPGIETSRAELSGLVPKVCQLLFHEAMRVY